MRPFTLFLFISFSSFGQISQNINLLDRWFDNNLTTNSSLARYNDCWGYVANGREYAMIGSTEGIHFFEITQAGKLNEIDFVRGKFSNSDVIHRDIKTFKNYAYAVCDEGNSSLQIIDLSYLPDSVHLVVDTQINFGRVHNLFIDETNELLYACLVTPMLDGNPLGLIPMRVFSLADPLNPSLLYQGPGDIPEVHDAYVRDNIAYLSCGFDGLRVYDFNNPSTPVFMQNLQFYQDQGYNHQGWMTPDGNTFIFGDETEGKRLKRCEVGNNNLLQIRSYFGTNYLNGSVPHNIMCDNDFAFVAYYNEGLRIYNLNSIMPKEVAFYDTYSQEHFFKMNGAWGVYSKLPSERILVSDRQFGLHLLDFQRSTFININEDNVLVFPNPWIGKQALKVVLSDPEISNFEVQLFDFNGKLLLTKIIFGQSYTEISTHLSSGFYHIKVIIEEKKEIYFQKLLVD